ncbi:MAG: hypothetical protein CUN53_05185 [Phototrophicales bacterium]|nr:MAG: hypothetical protein CUN53_05185 [Phototrophicales bacterium]
MKTISRRQFLMAVCLSAAASHFAARTAHSRYWIAAADAPIRQWGAADAPLIARVSQGQTAVEVDRIETDGGRWIAVADSSGNRIGWSPAGAWRLSET